MSRPAVRRALRDPAIAQALYHNLQSSFPGGMASVVPPPGQPGPPPPGPPPGMASGGDVDSMLSPEQAAERSAGSRTPAQVAQMQQIGFNPDTDSPGQRPLRFQSGGVNDQASVMAQLTGVQAELSQPSLTPERRQALMAQQAALMNRLQVGQTGTSGLTKLAQAGPPTLPNTALAAGVGALMGAGTTRMQGPSALVGAGMAAGLNYLLRKYGKRQQQQTPGTGTVPTSPQATTPPGTAFSAPQSPQQPLVTATANLPRTSSGLIIRGPAGDSTIPQDTSAPNSDQGTAVPAGSGQGLWMASSPEGNVYSNDGGRTWKSAQTDKPYTGGNVVNATPISPQSSLIDASPTTTVPANAPVTNQSGGSEPEDYSEPEADSELMDELGFGRGGAVRRRKFAEGGESLPVKRSPRAVLMRKPAGIPLPVLHTTIVIAALPKKGKSKQPPSEKKLRFGGSPVPRRPHAIPPLRGPQNGDDRPRPHGRVQVPRGSGAAIKGKRFGGIY